MLAALAPLLVAVPVAEAKRVRVFAVSPRYDVAWVQDREAYAGKLAALVDAKERQDSGPRQVQQGTKDVVPLLLGPADRSRPGPTARDLVALPDGMGFLSGLTGSRGGSARRANDLSGALASLLVTYAPQVSDVQNRFPELGARPLPAARALMLAMTDTFGRVGFESAAALADRLDAYVAVGAVMPERWRIVCTSRAAMPPLPGGRGCDAEAPSRVSALRTTDEGDRPYAYEALSARPNAVTLVFDPTGRLVAQMPKAYLAPAELSGGLDLAPGPVSAQAAVPTPVGRLGFALTKDAFMPDVVAKLDAEGAEILVQPSFMAGETVSPSGMWAPDALKSAGYADMLRHPAIEAVVVPSLVGNVFDLSADAQGHVALQPRATRGGPVGNLIGQTVVPGLAAVAPWIAQDPLSPEEPLPERRRRLGEAGRRLQPNGPGCPEPGKPAPCRTGHAESVVFADVQVGVPPRLRRTARHKQVKPFTANRPLSPSSTPQRNVSLSASGSTVFAAFEQGDRIRVARSDSDGASFNTRVGLNRGRGRQRWPSISAGPGAEVWVAWQQLDGSAWRAFAARSVDRGRTFGRAVPLAADGPDGRHQWRPVVAATGAGSAVAAWIDERGAFADEPGLPQAQVRSSRLRASGVESLTVTPSLRLDPPSAASGLATTLDHAWAPSLAARSGRVVLTWTDFRQYDWDVLTRVSDDGGASWGGVGQVNDTPVDREALDDTARAAIPASGPAIVAWSDWRRDPATSSRAHTMHDVFAAPLGVGRTLRADGDGRTPRPSFSPAIAPLGVGSGVAVAWQSHGRGHPDVHAAVIRSGRRGRVRRVDDTRLEGSAQHRPAVAVTDRRIVVAWEDDRDGPAQIYVARAAPSRMG